MAYAEEEEEALTLQHEVLAVHRATVVKVRPRLWLVQSSTVTSVRSVGAGRPA